MKCDANQIISIAYSLGDLEPTDTEADISKEAYDREVEMRYLVEELRHHVTGPDVTPELAYMDRLAQERSFELDRIWPHAYSVYGVGRAIFLTESGYFGMGPPGMTAGDKIVSIPGSNTILALAPYAPASDNAVPTTSATVPVEESTSAAEDFQLVGACYVHGCDLLRFGISQTKLQAINLH